VIAGVLVTTTTTDAPRVLFVDDYFPLLLCIGPKHFDEAAVAEMAAGYERYFVRGDRYSLITCSPRDAVTDARGRKMIVDWANSPRVRQKSRELCVGSSTVVPNALARGALTALLWLWKPSSPHHVVASSEEGIDWCLARIAEARLVLPGSSADVRRDALRRVRNL
jgi:hypothetical protein